MSDRGQYQSHRRTSDICDLRGNLLKEAPVGFNFENVLKALLVLSKAVNLDLQMQPKKTVVKYPYKWGKLNMGTPAGSSLQTNIYRYAHF